MSTTELREDILYFPEFLSDHRMLYGDVLEEFFAQEPEPVLFGGSRIGGLSLRTDRPNSYTEMGSIKRSVLRRRLWLPTTGMIAGQVGSITGVNPSIAVLNFYRDGEDYLEFHSDLDRQIGPRVDDVIVATVSFGAERPFQMRRIDGSDELEVLLRPGSLFVMRGHVQRQWLHAVPKTNERGSRLSITYLHHQLDPESMCCWVLSRINDDTKNALKKYVGEDAIGDAVRNYDGTLPTPVLISSREVVFIAWCRRKDWHEHIVVGGSSEESYLTPQSLLQKHPHLREHIPEDSKVEFSTPDLSDVRRDLPNPKDVPLKNVPTDWLEEMIDVAINESESRKKST